MNAYDGVEELDSFSPDELAAYRKILLEKTKPQVEFIKRHFGDKLYVTEACCGNGRLLMGLGPYLMHGCGVDISESRIDFADDWLWTDGSLYPIQFEVDDVLRPREGESFGAGHDLSVCITGAFNYFAGNTLVEAMKHSLYNGKGSILLEIYKLPVNRGKLLSCNDWKLKTWYELPIEDKFCYYLEDFQYDPIKRVMMHEKTFIGRNGKIDTGRVETLHYYTELEVRLMLSLAGFKKVEFYGDWDDTPYSEELSDKMVVIATL